MSMSMSMMVPLIMMRRMPKSTRFHMSTISTMMTTLMIMMMMMRRRIPRYISPAST